MSAATFGQNENNRAVQAMIRKHLPLLAALALAACSGNPLSFGEAVTPEPPPPVNPEDPAPIEGVSVPAGIAQHVRTASYTPGAPTAQIDLRSLDGTPISATYQRATQFDVAGFEAYTIQETRAQRQFLALFKRGNHVEAGAIADGGQFGKYFGGGTFRRLVPNSYTLPTPVTPLPTETNLNPQPTLLATYVGGYVGLLNSGPIVPNSTLDPQRSFRVTGDVAINADFENMKLNGRVTNRLILPDPEA
ncbi:MAG: hypothetical protein Q8K20_01600, partial [Gemmobacter sp.]|nr:hypothetical protein [Gemmobacter sp.]